MGQLKVKLIPLTNGLFAKISDQDYWLVRQFKWCASRNRRNWYAQSGKGKGRVKMHRLIAGFPPFRLDHKNRNGIDNRRSNLRPAAQSQNCINHRRRIDNTSGFTGVYWNKEKNLWQALLGFRYRKIYLGDFPKISQAIRARKQAELQHFGEFARAN